MSDLHKKIIIIGSGPAGLTAAIYNARADLFPLVLEGMQPGGQLTITNDIENFPGFEHGIQGPALMDIMRKQAQRFGADCRFEYVTEVDFNLHPFKVKTNEAEYTADAVIIATGASAKYLPLESIEKYKGYGVSACATCDAFFYRNRKVLVLGGGDTAMEEADHLTKFASEVGIVHRRDEFRASKTMIERVKKNPKVKFYMNSNIKEVVGKEENNMKFVTGAILENTKDGSTQLVEADGIFMGIGHHPNTEVFKNFLETDQNGYLIVKAGTTFTNIPGVFAAGDVADPKYRQAISAAGSGCMAALDAERWLAERE